MGCCNFFLRLGFVTGTGGEREEPAGWIAVNLNEQNSTEREVSLLGSSKP
jgi:hypothetical protein